MFCTLSCKIKRLKFSVYNKNYMVPHQVINRPYFLYISYLGPLVYEYIVIYLSKESTEV